MLPRWEPGREASTLLAGFAAAFPVRRPSYLATPGMIEYLLTRSEATIGEVDGPAAQTLRQVPVRHASSRSNLRRRSVGPV